MTQEVKSQNPQDYLGDGVYVDFDGFQFRLYTWAGNNFRDEIFLEPSVVEAFLRFRKRMEESHK